MYMMISFVIPLYNRPEEIHELLESMTKLDTSGTSLSYEVIVVEDGSTQSSEGIVYSYRDRLPLRYVTQLNGGPGSARNTGADMAVGEMLVFLDSDTVLPADYLQRLDTALITMPADVWGGPDRSSDDFTVIQCAIDYSMTSFFTTGGIRGGEKSMDTFYPRSFNMGVRKDAYRAVGGFRVGMRYGEDLDLSMRLMEHGYRSALYPDVWLYHKRRTDFGQFFRQVYHSGRARIALNRLHPGTLKSVHYLPALFVIFTVLSVLGAPFGGLFPHVLYALLIIMDVCVRRGGSMDLALYAVVAAYVQLTGYGVGFLSALLSGDRDR